MSDFDKRFRRMKTIFWIFSAIVSALIVCWFVLIGFGAYKAAEAAQDADWSGGIKPVIEKLWRGKAGCLGS